MNLLLEVCATLFIAFGAMAQSAEDYQRTAMQREGDVARGKDLFNDESRLACGKCHSVDGNGGKAGPDLFAAGDQFARRDLIDAILHPSAGIAVGYSTTIVETISGDEHSGVLKEATADWIELACGDGQRQRVLTGEIKAQRGSSVSLMPEGLQQSLSLQEFSDVVEYLVSLKETPAAHEGMPENIPPSTDPVSLRPILDEPLRVSSDGRQTIQPGLVALAALPGRDKLFLAADQAGVIWRIDITASPQPSIFADLTGEAFSASGPNGLLGLAFHPGFPENRKYYLKHQVFEEGKIATVIVERVAARDLNRDSGVAPRRLLKIVAVAEHHNGGCIQFGPDGFLYIGMGDSAPNHDPQGHGQDLSLLLGKMLRIDVDRRDPGLEYAVPADNPFVAQKGARAEIWASGLREPWRFSFDSITGELWVADLGQERGDEVTIIRRGENHGWNVYEGFDLFSGQYRADHAKYIPPIFATRRKQGAAIVGGLVYRGDVKSPFYGAYIFGDHVSKRIWALRQRDRKLQEICELAIAPHSITAFASDHAGRVFVAGYQGMIYQLDLCRAPR